MSVLRSTGSQSVAHLRFGACASPDRENVLSVTLKIDYYSCYIRPLFWYPLKQKLCGAHALWKSMFLEAFCRYLAAIHRRMGFRKAILGGPTCMCKSSSCVSGSRKRVCGDCSNLTAALRTIVWRHSCSDRLTRVCACRLLSLRRYSTGVRERSTECDVVCD